MRVFEGVVESYDGVEVSSQVQHSLVVCDVGGQVVEGQVVEGQRGGRVEERRQGTGGRQLEELEDKDFCNKHFISTDSKVDNI